MSDIGIKACFIGGARYSQPLDTTTEKKFRALRPLGEMFVIGFSQNLRPRKFTEHAQFYLLPKMPLPLLRYVEMFALGPFLALWLIFRHGVRVLVGQSPYESFAGALAKKIAGCCGRNIALVVESHGDFEESVFLQRRIRLPRWYRSLMTPVARFALKEADIVRAVSNSTRVQLERWVPAKRLMQFPAWTDIEIFLQAGQKNRTPDSQDILYAGVLIPLKGVHHLIGAFARIASDYPSVRLLLVGHSENKRYVAGLENQIRQHRLNERVQFVGKVSQAELAECMMKACVFVLPSMSEGLGRVVIEAMATSIPVIGSRVGGIPELIEDGVTGFLVSPGDEMLLSDKLRWILEHPVESREMGRRARGFAEHFFSTEMYVEGYRRVFQSA